MSDHEPTPGRRDGAPPDDRDPTTAQMLVDPVAQSGPSGEDDADVEWVSQATHGVRIAIPVATLIAVGLVAAGFWAGAALQKSQNSSSGTGSLAGLAARLRSGLAGGATGASGLRGFGGAGAAGAAAIGTVSVVNGDTLYVQSTTTGSIVKVTLGRSTTVTRNASARPADLRPGDTVVVEGTTSTGGAVTATSVSATAPGVRSTLGGGRGGFLGALGGGATGSSGGSAPSLFGGG
jgi:hypothetical protein